MKTQQEHYKYFIENHKPTDSLYVGWSSPKIQKANLLQIADCVKDENNEICDLLDVGCGIGRLGMIAEINDYHGIDLMNEYIKVARKIIPNAHFYNTDLFFYEEKHNYVVANGTFNLKVKNQADYIRRAIDKMLSLARERVVFSLLSIHHPNKINSDIYYYNPSEILDYCLTRGCKTKIIHDYLPGHFIVSITK